MVHVLDGLEGCGVHAEDGIKSQFFTILERLVFELKNQSMIENGDYNEKENHSFYLVDAICLWDFRLNDHERLAKLDFFSAIGNPECRPDNPLTRRFG